MSKIKNNSLLGIKTSWAANVPIKLTAISASIFLLFGITGAVYTNYTLSENRAKISYVAEVSQLSERLGKLSPVARQGNETSFNDLNIAKERISKLLNILSKGGSIDGGTEIKSISQNSEFIKLVKEWESSERYVKALIDGKTDIVALKKLSEQSLQNLALMEEGSTNFYKNMSRRGGAVNSQEFYILYNRISQGINSLFLGNEYNIEVGYNLVKDLRTFDNLMEAYKTGSSIYGVEAVRTPELREDIRKLELAFSPFRDLTLQLVPSVEQLETAKVLSNNLILNADKLLNTSVKLNNSLEKQTEVLGFYNYIIYLLFLLSLASAFLLAIHFLDKEKQTADMVKALSRSQNNQAAIDLLKEQLKPIARRDFTHRVYISDDFVTQIAERIEKIRLSFSDVVRQMKRSSFNISKNADNTDNSSRKLVEVSDLQNAQLQESITQIAALTTTIDQVAQETWFAERKSLEAATASQEGGELVKKTMIKMNEIRENIQESSKKIKKSSESAQAISVITELIKNVTKKIEVLSLNAAIQASSSGEAGREFRVVATEVQRLAVESRASTSDILKLVQEVQQDIAAAVSSMEITTQGVVEGARLTESAGLSLTKTESLSAEVASGISKTTKSLESKSEEMAEMSVKMRDLQKTTDKAKDIIQVTVKQVESLNKISKELAESVSEYKIEEQDL